MHNVIAWWNCCIICSSGGHTKIANLTIFALSFKEYFNFAWHFIFLNTDFKNGNETRSKKNREFCHKHFIENDSEHVNFDISMHLFLICFTLLCSVFRISMKLDIYEDAHCCTYCERNRTKRLLRHVTLNMAFLGITSRCNSHVRSLMKGRKQSFFPRYATVRKSSASSMLAPQSTADFRQASRKVFLHHSINAILSSLLFFLEEWGHKRRQETTDL